MKKLILLPLMLLFFSTANAQFDAIDTVSYNAETYYIDTLEYKFGTKTFTIWNNTTGTLSIAFDNGNGVKDTTNVYSLSAGTGVVLPERLNRRLYLKSTVAGSVSVICDYGTGGNPYFYPFSEDGSSTVTTYSFPLADTSLIWASDTVTAAPDTLSKFSRYTIANLLAKFPNRMRLDITADSTIQISTDPSFPTGATFRLLTGESFGFENFSGATELYIRGFNPDGTTVGIRRWRISAKGR